MILRLEVILSVASYEKNLKNLTFKNYFCNRIFPYCRFLPIFEKLFDIYKSWLIFLRKIFFTTLLFPILKVKFSVAKVVKRFF